MHTLVRGRPRSGCQAGTAAPSLSLPECPKSAIVLSPKRVGVTGWVQSPCVSPGPPSRAGAPWLRYNNRHHLQHEALRNTAPFLLRSSQLLCGTLANQSTDFPEGRVQGGGGEVATKPPTWQSAGGSLQSHAAPLPGSESAQPHQRCLKWGRQMPASSFSSIQGKPRG